jgi:PAS domain S-box-containing protein
VVVLAGLYLASEYNYLLFHTLAEGFAIAVACGIFMVAWNSRRFLQNNYVLFLGVAYLFVGGLDLVHTLSYMGMNVFPGYGADLPTQLWIAARYMEALSLLAAPLLIGRRLSAGRALVGYAAVSAALLWAIFGGVFPSCFVEGQGLTPFKKASEYVISGILLGSVYTLHGRRRHFDPGVLKLIYSSVVVTIAAEMAFTLYVSAYGFSNLVGHYLKLVSFVLLYRAVIMTGLREPYNLIFRDLKRSQEKYQSLFTEMLNGFAYNRVVTDESGKPVDCVFLEANDSFERLTGLKREDVIGRRVTEVLPGIEHDPADWIGVFGRVALTGEGARFEQYAQPLGKWFSVAAYSPKRGYFSVVFEDITERKRAEDVMNRYQEHLEELVAERTADLVAANEELEREIAQRTKAEAQLLQSQKMEAVGQLAGGIAHDFNNRLFAIRNYAYILKSAAGDPQVAENAERILASCDKAAKLVDDLLSFSRRKEINPRPLDVASAVGDSEGLLRVAAGKRVDFRLELPAERLTVMADATTLEHALINLVTNARDAMPGGGTVTVKAGKADPAKVPAGAAFHNGGQRGPYAVVSVSDTGPGMDEKTRRRIFEPFFTTKEPGKGTGLGLAMVYGAVTQQGGFVDVQSEPGRGTTLSIYLPLGL